MTTAVATATELTDDGWHLRVASGSTAAPGAWMFDRAHYQARGALEVQPRGRGSVAFVTHGGAQWVLRHYQRSGLPARFVRNHYLWFGLARTRPWREFAVLQYLTEAGMPVPRPVAAGVRREGATYVGALVTERLAQVETLEDRLSRAPLTPEVWHDIGVVVGRLHRLGVHHSDLNVTNTLLGPGDRVYLIDFDNALLRSPAWLRAAGLRRLQRSFRKACRRYPDFRYDESCWEQLIRGYTEGRDGRC